MPANSRTEGAGQQGKENEEFCGLYPTLIKKVSTKTTILSLIFLYGFKIIVVYQQGQYICKATLLLSTLLKERRKASRYSHQKCKYKIKVKGRYRKLIKGTKTVTWAYPLNILVFHREHGLEQLPKEEHTRPSAASPTAAPPAGRTPDSNGWRQSPSQGATG